MADVWCPIGSRSRRQVGGSKPARGVVITSNLDKSREEWTKRPVRILLVDDAERWARVTGELLEERQDTFEVDLAHSLREGARRFEDTDPDCVICDYQLGDGTGLSLLETVRQRDVDRPFILVTGRGNERIASDAIGEGVTDYIQKGSDDTGELLASRVRNAIRTYRAQRAFHRERRSKDAMLDILKTATTERELLAEYCTHLASAHNYYCVWIGLASESDGLIPQAVAGREQYLHDVGLGDPTTDVGDEPSIRAHLQNEPVFVSVGKQQLETDDPGEWVNAAMKHDFTGAGALPIRYDGVQFGVLGVYGDDVLADEREQRFLNEYAGTIGYALRTTEWKRSLLSSHSIQLDLDVTDDDAPLVALSRDLGRSTRIEVLSVVDRSDELTLYLTEIEGASSDEIADCVDGVDGIDVTAVNDSTSPTVCELSVETRTPERVVAECGGQFERSVVEGGVATVSITVPDERTFQSVKSTISTVYESSTVSTVWTGRNTHPSRLDDPLTEQLTERQRTVLLYAYHHGYFDRPRGISATELAERLDISRTTLTQHLRAAQRKVFDQVLTDDSSDAP